jgi:hypothetical protein
VPFTVSTTIADEPGPLPSKLTEVALSRALRLVELLVEVIVIVPLNPLTLLSVMFVEFDDPESTISPELAALMLKSTLTTETCVAAENDMLGAVPFTTMVSLPVTEVALTLRLTVFDPPGLSITLVEFRALVKHPQPMTDVARFTGPLKLLILVSVMIDVPLEPAWTESDGGLAEIVNPWTSATTVTFLACAPVPATTVTL